MLSKSLYVRIGSHDFIRSHTLRSPKKFTIIHQACNNNAEADKKNMYTIHSEAQLSSYADITPVHYPFGSTFIRVVGSCNGILCLYDHYDMCTLHLWNPSIRRKVPIHDLPSLGSCRAFRFGFDPVIDDYKILCTSLEGTFVYTLKTRTWREIASPATPYNFVESSPCLFNGAIYWVVGVLESKWNHNFKIHLYIMTFDLSSEVFSTIELPEPYWESCELTIVKGCLAVISSEHDHDRHSWISVRNTVSASWCACNKLNKFKLTTYGNLLFRHKSNGIKVYNPNTEARSRLRHLTDSSFINYMVTCIESLELLDNGTTCD